MQRFCLQEFLGPLQGQAVTQGPVGVSWVHEVTDSLYPVLWLLHLQPLTTHITSGRQVSERGVLSENKNPF